MSHEMMYWTVAKEISSKDTFLKNWWPFCSAKLNLLINFGLGHHEKHLYGIVFNLENWFRRYCLKYFLSGALEALLFSANKLFVQFRQRVF